MRQGSRVWIENEETAVTVDLANFSYALMLRSIAFSFVVPRPSPEKALAVDLALGLMRAVTHLAERAARLPAGPSNPGCNAGVSFAALRDAAPLPPGASSRRFFNERLQELADAAAVLTSTGDPRAQAAARQLAKRGARGFAAAISEPQRAAAAVSATASAPTAANVHAASSAAASGSVPAIFAAPAASADAAIPGPWINPDALDVEALVGIAHVCPSGAIRYRRKDGRPEEKAPPVNLGAIREAGPYAVREDILLDGEPAGFRLTLCRCGTSKNRFARPHRRDRIRNRQIEPGCGAVDHRRLARRRRARKARQPPR